MTSFTVKCISDWLTLNAADHTLVADSEPIIFMVRENWRVMFYYDPKPGCVVAMSQDFFPAPRPVRSLGELAEVFKTIAAKVLVKQHELEQQPGILMQAWASNDGAKAASGG